MYADIMLMLLRIMPIRRHLNDNQTCLGLLHDQCYKTASTAVPSERLIKLNAAKTIHNQQYFTRC